MNSLCVIHAGRAAYYGQLGKEDYYTGGYDPQGFFSGRGAAKLGVEDGMITSGDIRLKNLFSGLTPDGSRVMRRGGGTVREYLDKKTGQVKRYKPVVAYDNTFSAPKDISVLWALSPDDIRDKVHEIHKDAVKEAVKYLEDQIYTRTKHTDEFGRVSFEHHKAQGVFASFHHTTSRDLDPQLHTHVLVINAAIREDGKGYGAVDGKGIFEARYVAGQIYQNYMRREVEKQLQVKTFDRPFSDEKGMSFGIDGVTATVKEHFSKRSLCIPSKFGG